MIVLQLYSVQVQLYLQHTAHSIHDPGPYDGVYIQCEFRVVDTARCHFLGERATVVSDYTVIVKEYPQDFDRQDPLKNVPYYPIFNAENMTAHGVYKRLAQRFSNLVVLGRLADYQYYNMDDAVNNALSCFGRMSDDWVL